MPKAKRKATPQPIGDYVDQIRAGEGFTDARVVMMPGEVKREALNTRKRQCAALRWGWLTQQQQGMLVLFDQACAEAGWDLVRSALCPPTGGDGARPERLVGRRMKHQAMERAVRNQLALLLVKEALENKDNETLDQIAERWFGGRRAHNRENLECWIASVADDLFAWHEAGERVPVRVPVVVRQDVVDAWAEGLIG
jgi:hypothetical protein